MGKIALVLASFGVENKEARENGLAKLVEELEAALPCDVFEAYTSAFIRNRLLARGIAVPSLRERLAALKDRGYTEIYIQPTHLTPAEEFEKKVMTEAREAKTPSVHLRVGEPLFYGDRDYRDGLLTAFGEQELGEDEELVFLGHGSPHRHNPVYERVQRVADMMKLHCHIGVVEESDTPNFEDVLGRLKSREAKNVLLAPLLLSCGVHVKKDMAGEVESSWRSRLEAAGFKVRVNMRGLCEFARVRELYIGKAKKLLAAGPMFRE